MLVRNFKYMLNKLRVSYELIRLSNDIDMVFFYIGAKLFVLAHLVARLLKKKTVVIVAGPALCTEKIYSGTLLDMGGIVFSKTTAILEKVAYRLADQIVAEVKNVIYQLGLKRYKNKIALSGSFFDASLFGLKQPLSDRRNVVGYIGRLSEEKGLVNR
jgi:glycosyltransferase involved in cell wall biosynthesis